MKKFLTMLLALSVVFTYTFGAVGSVFAATVTDEYKSAQLKKVEVQCGYMNTALTQAMAELVSEAKASAEALEEDYDGFLDADKFVSEAGLQEFGEKLISDWEEAAVTAIKALTEDNFAIGNVEIALTIGSTPAKIKAADLNTLSGMKATLSNAQSSTNGGTSYEALLDICIDDTYANYVKLVEAIDETKYSTGSKDYPTEEVADQNVISGTETIKVKGFAEDAVETYDGQGYIAAVESTLKDALGSAKESTKITTAAARAAAYKAIYECKADLLAAVLTKDAEKKESEDVDVNVSAQIALYKQAALADLRDAKEDIVATYNFATSGSELKAALYNETEGTVLGVKVKDATKLTKAEADAINAALTTAVESSYTVLENYARTLSSSTLKSTWYEKYVNTDGGKLGVADDKLWKTIKKVAAIDSVVEDLDTLANSYKSSYIAGKKQYDDAKVDAALAEAKKAVTLDFKETSITKDAEAYMIEGVKAAQENNAATLADLKLDVEGLDAFKAAVADAKAVFDDATNAKVDTENPYGDAAFLKNTYENGVVATEWARLVVDYKKQLDVAESYADINEVLAAAKAEFAKLELNDGKTADCVEDAREAAIDNLEAYKAYLESTTYKTVSAGKVDYTTALTKALADGRALINEAFNVADVNANLEKAKALFVDLKTMDEMKAAKEAVEAQIKALPINITAADADKVVAAFDAYADYKSNFGATATEINTSRLGELGKALNAIVTIERKALDTEIADFLKALPATAVSDADVAAWAAKKADIEALIAKIDVFNEKQKNDDKTGYRDLLSTYYTVVELKNTTAKTILEGYLANQVRESEKTVAVNALLAAAKDTATLEEQKAAMDAYKALTEKQQLEIAERNAVVIATVEQKIAAAEEAAKYTDKDAKADLLDMARKVTIWRTSKTSIKVTAVGSVKNIKDNGYTVKYTFYKKAPGAKAYKAIKTTTSNKYTYTNLKKGTNKFQIKVKVYDAEGKLVASKMTYYRAAKVK